MDPYHYAKPGDYYDWDYAQELWFEKNTRAALEAEIATCEADFDAWFEGHKKNPRKALKALDAYPENKRLHVQRCHDIQLAWDTWVDHYYHLWKSDYKNDIAYGKERTFDQFLEKRSKYPACIPEAFLGECGPLPDWRTDKFKVEEQAMMVKWKAIIAERRKARQ